MASASTVSPGPSKFGSSFRSHVIISPKHENVNGLTLSASSSFLTNFTTSVCSAAAAAATAESTAANYPTSPKPLFQEEKQSLVIVNGTSSSLPDSEELTKKEPIGDSQVLEEKSEQMARIEEFDDNSSNSNSTSSDTSSTSRKKRRRGEEEILMQDLIGIDKSLADDITENLRIQPNDASNSGVAVKSEPTDSSECVKSKEDSPAFHLRPRRSHRSSFPGYCSSGSSSPIYYLSPIKRPKSKSPSQKVHNKYMQLFSDTTEKLNKLNESGGDIESNECKPKKLEESKPILRKVANSIVTDVNVAVFAEMISPLRLTANNVYPDNYISLRVVEIKPIRYVDLSEDDEEEEEESEDQKPLLSPILELATVDLKERYELSYMNGIFEDASHKQALDKILTVYLVGEYALKASEKLSEDCIISIVQFRTTKMSNSPVKRQQQETVKKRRVSANSKKAGPAENYSFQIIVDSPNDTFELIKQENGDSDEKVTDHNNNDLFVQQFIRTPRHSSANEKRWIPLVSIGKWQAPDDPRKLNKSLYIPQTCKPKFESTSRTVKPLHLLKKE